MLPHEYCIILVNGTITICGIDLGVVYLLEILLQYQGAEHSFPIDCCK